MADPLAALREALRQLDDGARAAAAKCPRCGRPDGGFVPAGQTPWDAGLVDRARCPQPGCPMRSRRDG